jgi:hypothetical protein
MSTKNQNQSEYAAAGGGGAICYVASSHPEPKPATVDDQLPHAELLRLFKWTDDDLATASCCGFPNARYQTFGVYGGREVRWSRQDVARWLERVKSLKVR